MKNVVSLISALILVALSFTSTLNATWVSNLVSTQSMYVFCYSNTGTEGDLLFEIPVEINQIESRWTGVEKFNGSDKTIISYDLLLPYDLKAGFFGDQEALAPLTKHPLTHGRTAFNEQHDLTLDLGYRIVLPTSLISLDDTILAADAYRNDIGLSSCTLTDSTFNSTFR